MNDTQPSPAQVKDLVSVVFSEKEVIDQDHYKDTHVGIWQTHEHTFICSVHLLTWYRKTWDADDFRRDESQEGFCWIGPFIQPVDLTNAIQELGTFSQEKIGDLIKTLNERKTRFKDDHVEE